MSIANPLATTNDLSFLDATLPLRTKPLRSLVLVHDEPDLCKRITDCVDSENTAVMQIPQPEWKTADPEFLEMIEWAVKSAQVEEIQLVGHSRAFAEPKVKRSQDSEKLFHGLMDTQRQMTVARQQLAEAILAVSKHVAKISDRDIRVNGIMYVSHGRSFVSVSADEA